ncbi:MULTISPECIES: aminoglycoside phosphotransferase family protein [Oceanobacillus]|uniref:Trifolitoxin immunity domain-containing protein n=1 Tax=Oceanobacillus kimchii TaxID=746691 RepID=A0ABQ5TIX1_9BACI|nr:MULTISPECIES: aminoglycoside phosphotransferase family protein [Oceanobacillus]MBT2598614.1 aminoglycoside phosphotransferase family protein [Oceanobacillus sp. ISL-74]MBT2651533.1 aminoglycoside phosphotransferase family protein [Oceanobacillus sp. ISL-73]GLO66092.1 trifolitoxin immunity domain-containing protein [Oceanobacillus kimchii]
MSNFENEERLTGGNLSNVYRLGETTRRELKAESTKIHKLLKHLENKGFSYAPKFLGIDEKGREILSFIEGEAGNYPLKEYMWSNDVLKEIAKMLRLYHDAVSDFPSLNELKPMDNTPDNIEIICHNDFAIYNIIFNREKPIGIIDFDVIAPGPRLWDIAYTLYTCVPLSRHYHTEKGEIVHYNPTDDAKRKKQRVELFFESYGNVGIKEGYLEMVLLRLEGLCKYMIRKANEGEVAFQEMIDEGHLEHYHKDIKFIREHGKEWI